MAGSAAAGMRPGSPRRLAAAARGHAPGSGRRAAWPCPARKAEMFQPDSGALVIMLMMVFAGLICCVIRARRLAVRLGAAVLAFVPAGLSGVAAVNMYYGYYRTWSAVAADFSGGGIGSYPALPDLGAGSAARL